MKEAILNKCTELYIQNGDFTIDELVKEFKMSKNTFYKYFRTKEDVYRAIVENIPFLQKNLTKRFYTKHILDLWLLINHAMNSGKYGDDNTFTDDMLFEEVLKKDWKRFLPVFERNR